MIILVCWVWVNQLSRALLCNILNLVLTTETDGVGDICVLAHFRRYHYYPIVFEYLLQFDNDVDLQAGG